MEKTFVTEQTWIQKLLLYASLFHVFIVLLAYTIYNIYAFVSSNSSCPHLMYGLFTLWVSIMFLLFMIQGLYIPNKYHLYYGLASITLITGYILWWRIKCSINNNNNNAMNTSIEVICYINGVLLLVYIIFSVRFINLQKQSNKHNNKRTNTRTTLTSSDIFSKCVPILLFDNEISTMYFVSCIHEYTAYTNSGLQLHIPKPEYLFTLTNPLTILCSILLICQWIITCSGYKIMNKKNEKYTLLLLICYCILLITGYIPLIPVSYVYQTLIKSHKYQLIFGPFFLLPLFLFITKLLSIYWLYQSHKHFKRKHKQKNTKTVAKFSDIHVDNNDDVSKGTSNNTNEKITLHPNVEENLSSSSNAHKHYVPPNPITVIRQLSASKTLSCKRFSDVCNEKRKNIKILIKLAEGFDKFNFNQSSASFISEIASEEIIKHLDTLYDAEDGFQTPNSSKSTNSETQMQQLWDHYMEFHKNTCRQDACKLLTKCPWNEHMKEHKNTSAKHKLLQFCVTRQQLLHVYFYHKDDYDMISKDTTRGERYVENSEDSKILTIQSTHSIQNKRESTQITNTIAIPDINTHHIDDENETDIAPDYVPGVTPLYDHSMLTNTSNSNVLNIEMTSVNGNRCDGIDEDDDESECKTLCDLLKYGCAENCTKSDIDKVNVIDENENEIYIKLYLHCITSHSEYKIECDDTNVCKYKQWKDKQQQTMRQMIHSEFYIHRESIDIIIKNDAPISIQKLQKSKSVPVEEDTFTTHEKEEKLDIIEMKYEYDQNEQKQQISYLPTMLSIIKSQTSVNFKDDQDLTHTKTGTSDGLNTVLQFGIPWQETVSTFKNPKQEILQNQYKPLAIREWNDLLRKCVGLSKTKKAKVSKLSLKQLVALKLYTDFDDLQRELRKCFRKGRKYDEHLKRQREFFHWNHLLETACLQSHDIIVSRLYHGVNKPLMLSSFSGTYYGPISTTTMFDIAKQFAGTNGRILELYPSYSKKGLKVSWLSNFPDEDEVLYMNASFEIVNIYANDKQTNIYRSPFDAPEATTIYEYNTDEEDSFSTDSSQHHHVTFTEQKTNTIHNLQHTVELEQNVQSFERSIMKAIQMININSSILSFNLMETKSDNDDMEELKYDIHDSGFDKLHCDEQIAVLYLLYLQYKKKRWKKFVQISATYANLGIARYRDQFITLAKNVQAVKLEKAPKIIQQFFAQVHLSTYKFPTKEKNGTMRNIFKLYQTKYKNEKYILNLSTFCKLFPNCKQLMINGDNFDWSLNEMINFLTKHNLDFSKISLYDIYIRFGDDYDDIDNSEREALKKIKENELIEKQLSKLSLLGWEFVKGSRCHLHRYGFKPHPQLPFLELFFDNIYINTYEDGVKNKNKTLNKFAMKDIFNMSYSSKMHAIDKSKKSNQSGRSIRDKSSRKSSRQSRASSAKSPIHSFYSSDLNNEGQIQFLKLAWSRTSSYKSLHSNNSNEGVEVHIVAYNDNVCDLSINVLNKHKHEHQINIINLLQSIKDKFNINDNNINNINITPQHIKFEKLCKKINRLILDPMSKELKDIFMEKSNTTLQRIIVSFDTIINIFPNCEDIFLRDTQFTLRIWYHLLKTINNNSDCKLNRLFFSKHLNNSKYFRKDYLKTMDLRLKPHGWELEPHEQVIFKHI